MQIRNEILLFIIEFLSNFLELNAMWQPHREGTSMPNFIPPTPRPRGGHREGAGRPTNSEIIMVYLNRRIRMAVAWEDTQYVATHCILDGARKNSVPNAKYRGKHDYYTFALYGIFNGYEVPCVIYVKQDIGEFPEVLAAKPPTKATTGSGVGVPTYPNPDKNTWFITYATVDFVVTQEIIDGATVTQNIAPMHYYNNHPTFEEIMRGVVDTFEAYVGGQRFLAFLSDGLLVGCMVPPEWWTDEVQAHVLRIPRNALSTMRNYMRARQMRGH